jgi:hypothetical protein
MLLVNQGEFRLAYFIMKDYTYTANGVSTLCGDITDIFELLKGIERSPGLFMLEPNLENLHSFLGGYLRLAEHARIEIKNLNKYYEFRFFLKKELNEKYENTMGWYGHLMVKYGSEQGFSKFFEHFNRFKETLQL